MFQVKNYDSEVDLDPAIDTLSLYSLRQLSRLADDAFDNMMDQKGLYEDDVKE